MRIRPIIVPKSWASYYLKGDSYELTAKELKAADRYLKEHSNKYVLEIHGRMSHNSEELIVFVSDEDMTPNTYRNVWENAIRWQEESP